MTEEVTERPAFAAQPIRNLVDSQGEVEIALERLSHTSTATTKRFYRSNVTNVTSLCLITLRNTPENMEKHQVKSKINWSLLLRLHHNSSF